MLANPFRPSFGTSPPLLVGRDDIVAEFGDSLDDGPSAPGRATLFVGARGSGKTAVLNDLSPVDRSFLVAMAHSEGPAAMSDIATRLGADANYTSQYRLRLIHQDIIQPAGRGNVEFVLPHLREYLQEHAAMLAQTGTRRTGPLDD